MKLTATVTKFAGHIGDSLVVQANANRVGLRVVASTSSKASYADIYLDSIASGKLIGHASYYSGPPFTLSKKQHGDLVTRRIIVQISPPGLVLQNKLVGIIQVFRGND